jgi:uncharacterized protein (DUF305 family)
VRRLGCFVVIAVLAAGCATPAANQPAANDQTDVWFMQHMVPYLRQTTVVVSMAREHLTDPELAQLADTVTRRSQADIDQLQRWLDLRGLSPHGPSHQRVDNTSPTDLERLAALRGRTLDLAFVQVMTARSRAGNELATTEAHDGSLPEVRQLAQQLLAEQQTQIATMTTWKRAWSKAHPSHLTARDSGHSSGDGRR